MVSYFSLIFGFCGKEEAERLLTECQTSTLLIRFSDIEANKNFEFKLMQNS